MEATETGVDRRSLAGRVRDGISWVFNTRAVRFPILLIAGAAITFWIAHYVQGDYIALCKRYAVFPSRCEVVDLQTAYATGLGVAGLVMLIIGPVVNSIYHLMRYGQPWEHSRVETAISNYPLLAGVIYMAIAGILVFV